MQENEFEKQVKEMMEGFKPIPSDAAWENISRKLEKERPRRRPFVFLLAFGVIIAVGIGYYFTKEKAQETIVAANDKNTTNAGNSSALKDSGSGSSVQKDADIKNNTALLPESKADKFKPVSPVTSEKAPLKLSTTLTGENRNLPVHHNTTAQQNVLPQPTANPLMQDVIPAADKPASKELTSTETTANTADAVKELVNTDSAEKSNTMPDSTVIAQNEQPAEPVKQAKKTVASEYALAKWQWGVNASYGKSNAVKNLANTKESNPQYLSLPVNNGGGVVYHNEYVYKPSASYSFGIDVQRKVLKNAVVGSGLNFTHISTKSDVSRKVDSSVRSSADFSGGLVNGYFPPGVSEEYTNTYNFIELPLYFQQEFLPRKKFSFSYNAGFSLRQLISSKSLIYNEENNIYFSKNEMLRKTQFQFMAGLNFKFNTGKTSSVYVGPQFSYSLSNMLKSKDYGNFHFMTYGIKAGLLLHKK